MRFQRAGDVTDHIAFCWSSSSVGGVAAFDRPCMGVEVRSRDCTESFGSKWRGNSRLGSGLQLEVWRVGIVHKSGDGTRVDRQGLVYRDFSQIWSTKDLYKKRQCRPGVANLSNRTRCRRIFRYDVRAAARKTPNACGTVISCIGVEKAEQGTWSALCDNRGNILAGRSPLSLLKSLTVFFIDHRPSRTSENLDATDVIKLSCILKRAGREEGWGREFNHTSLINI